MIIFLYLFRQLLATTFAVCSVLCLVLLSSRFVKYLAEAATGKWEAGALLALIGYRLPEFLELILPLSFFLSIMLAYGRLYLDSEMTVLSACGVSQKRLLGYTMVTALVIAALVGWLSTSISPTGSQKFAELELAQQQRGELDAMPAKRFQSLSAGGGVAYSEEVKDGRLTDVFHTESRVNSDGETEQVVVVAKSGYQQRSEDGRENFLVLEDGYRIEGTPGQADFRITYFEEFGKRLANTAKWRGQEPEGNEIPTEQLWNSDNPKHIAALHWRLSLPLLVLIVTLLAVPLSRTNPRQGRYLKLLPAVLLYIVYLLSLKSGQDKVTEGEVSVYAGIWGVHLVFFLIAWAIFSWGGVQQQLAAGKQKRLNGARSKSNEGEAA